MVEAGRDHRLIAIGVLIAAIIVWRTSGKEPVAVTG